MRGEEFVHKRDWRVWVDGGAVTQGVFPSLLEGGFEVVAHAGGGVGVQAAHAGDVVAEALFGEDFGDAVLGTGRERFTNRVEYLEPSSGEMRALALVDASLLLPQVHQAVT